MTQNISLVTSEFFQLEKITHGVYAAIATDGAGTLGNAGFVDLGEDVLVFDTFLTPQAAGDLKMAIQQLIGKPVKYVVNSHYHGDHVFGNQVFKDAAIISTETTRNLILEKNAIDDLENEQRQITELIQRMETTAAQETDELRRKDIWNNVSNHKVLLAALPALALTPPTVIFDHHLTIHGTKRWVELITYGGGHTQSDAFLYLPDEGIAFMADLVLVNATPLLTVGNPKEWLTILSRVKELKLDTIIPGHGGVGTVAENIDLMEKYIHFILNRLRETKKNKFTVDEVVAMELPSPFNKWESSKLYERNIRAHWDKV